MRSGESPCAGRLVSLLVVVLTQLLQGDIDAPSEPPCSRCKRESRECVFAPSRRGGNNTKRKMKDESTPPDLGMGSTSLSSSTIANPGHAHGQNLGHQSNQGVRFDNTAPFGGMGMNMGMMDGQRPGPGAGVGQSTFPHIQSQNQNQNQAPRVSNPYPLPQYPPNQQPDANSRHSFSIQNLLQPSPNNPSSSGPSTANYFGIPSTSTHFSPADQSTPSQPSHTPHGSSIPSMQPAGHSTPSPKRRRLHLHPPVAAGDPSSIVVADMQNESDALHILALASQHGERRTNDDDGRGGNAPQPRHLPDQKHKGKGRDTPAPDLRDFALIKLGIATKDQIVRLTDIFFKCHHHLLVSASRCEPLYEADVSQPMVPSYLIPRNPEQMASFAQSERYLLTTMVIIASRHDTSKAMRQVHDQSWAVMRVC